LYHIVDIHGLASILKASPNTLKKVWRSYPHFFIGEGRTLKGARFDVDDVLIHLKRQAGNVGIQTRKKRNLGRQIQIPEPSIQERGFQDPIRSGRLGHIETGGTIEPADPREDPFDLLSGIDSVS